MSLARSRRQQREQLDLGAVDVPAGEVGVLGAAVGLVDLPVHAGVGAADVVEGPRRQKGVVERRVEGVEQRLGAAADADPAQRLVPALAGAGARSSPKPRPRLSAARLARAPSTLTKEIPTRTVTVRSLAGVEGGVGAGLGGRARVGGRLWVSSAASAAAVERASLPGPGGVEAAVEDGGEVDPVARPLTAEEAAGGGAGDFAPAGVDGDRGEVVGLGAAAGVDEDAGVRVAREGEAGDAGPRRRRQRDVDVGAAGRVEPDRVEARPGGSPRSGRSRAGSGRRGPRRARAGEAVSGSVVGRKGKSP